MKEHAKKVLIFVAGLSGAMLFAALAAMHDARETCPTPEKLSHVEAMAQRWHYVSPGPMRDMCFSFTGTIADAFNDHVATKPIWVNVCLNFRMTRCKDGDGKDDTCLEIVPTHQWGDAE